MLFNSHIYIFIFLPIVFLLYFYIRKNLSATFSTSILVIASYVFYAYWNPKYIFLILGSIYLNYMIGGYIYKKKSRNLLILGIILNVTPLIFYKYTNFIIINLNNLFGLEFEKLEITLPLAISFFTFQQIAYLVDSYKKITLEYNLSSYSLFVSFFPQLIAGPIVHHKEMLPQFFDKKNINVNHVNIKKGLVLFTIGLFKKAVIADSFISIVSNGFDKNVALDFFEAWASTLSYTLQLYFDFSGYCDMAIGSAILFNIMIPENFNSPYKSKNIQEFWRNWHITLGKWLRDYIYIPLGGNKCSQYKKSFNLIVTFLIGGIWHGAGWNFLLWGAFHGIALVIHSAFKKLKIKVNQLLSISLTFVFVHFAWVFFRSENFERSIEIIKSMIGFNGCMLPKSIDKVLGTLTNPNLKPFLFNIRGDLSSREIMGSIFIGLVIVFFCPNSKDLSNKVKSNIMTAIITGALLAISTLFISRRSEFLYFQF